MKNSILIPFFALLLFGALSVSGHDKEKGDCKKERSCCGHGHRWRDHEFCHSDFSCYRAWKKDMKRERKEYLAGELSSSRPFAAERKQRKACKKAWKRDILAAHHESSGWGHDYWY